MKNILVLVVMLFQFETLAKPVYSDYQQLPIDSEASSNCESEYEYDSDSDVSAAASIHYTSGAKYTLEKCIQDCMRTKVPEIQKYMTVTPAELDAMARGICKQKCFGN